MYNMGGNPHVLRESLQPDLAAEAFSSMPLHSPGSGSSYHQWHKGGVTSPLACGRNRVSQTWPVTSVFWPLWVAPYCHHLHVFAEVKGAQLWVWALGEMPTLVWGSAQVGCMDWCSGILPAWGMSLQYNWNIRVYDFVQFQIVPGLILVPPRSVCVLHALFQCS